MYAKFSHINNAGGLAQPFPGFTIEQYIYRQYNRKFSLNLYNTNLVRDYPAPHLLYVFKNNEIYN